MLAACLCFRDSARDLHEWLLFHYVQGVTRFYLYDNDSTDHGVATLAPWIETGIVRLRAWPGLGQQQAIYDHCLATVESDVDWLAFIDDDEFLLCSEGASLTDALDLYSGCGGVAVSWLLFGSGGLESRPADSWVINTFTRRALYPDPHVKCIIQPRRVLKSRVVGHAFIPLPGYPIVDEQVRPLTEPLNPTPSADRFRIHHYLIKTWDEFLPRRLRAQVNTGTPKQHTLEQWREWDLGWNQVEDATAQTFAPAMRVTEQQLFGHVCGRGF